MQVAGGEHPVLGELVQVAGARVLRQVADGAVAGDRAAGGLTLPGEDAGEGGLAGTVAPDQTDPVAGVDAEGGPGEELTSPDAELHVLRTDHWSHSTGAPAPDPTGYRSATGEVAHPAILVSMTISYRPWREGDDVAARAALGEVDTPQSAVDRPLLGPDAPDPWRRTLVATDGGQVVAAAAVSEARLHPTRLWLYAEVAPTHRRQGIGTELVRRLRQEAAPSGVAALRSRYTSANHAAAGFTAALGMHAIQRSRMVRLGAGVLPEPMFGPAGPVLEDLATGSVELTRLVADYYDRVHESWDPSEMTLGRAQDLLLAPQTGAHGAVVLRDRAGALGGAVLAFAISYPAAPAEGSATEAAAPRQDTELLVGYDTELPPARARAALRQLLAMVAARYPVQVEVDDAMAPLAEVVDALVGAGSAEVVTETTLVALDEVP